MTTALVVLVAIIVVLVVERHQMVRDHARERERLLNAALAQDARDLALLNREPLPRPARVGPGEEGYQPPTPEGA